jgi:hypothetical protein
MRASRPCVEALGITISLVVTACVTLGACTPSPLIPYSADTPPLVLAPASHLGVQDQRGRFREIYCGHCHGNWRTTAAWAKMAG